MAETYCGKSCSICSAKEELNCPGCMNGPGMPIKGDCPIAICCRDKGHSECSSCSLKPDCTNWKNRVMQPDFRKEKIKADAEEKEYIAEYAPIMSKWFMILFISMVVSNISFIFTSDAIHEHFPSFYVICSVITGICTILYSVILFILSKVHERYTIAGICAVINSLYHFIEILAFKGDTPTWFALISLVCYISMIVEGYHFFNATSDTLMGVDNMLAAKWSDLWKWYKWMMIGVISSVVLILIAPVIGLIVMLVSVIGIIIIDIIKFVYIFQTGKAFKKVTGELQEKKPEENQE